MLHTRMRWLISAVAVLALLVTALASAPFLKVAHADSSRPQTYLALGDSVAFGYNDDYFLTTYRYQGGSADNFIGYPTPVGEALKMTITNAACPGETSSHFIEVSASTYDECQGYRDGIGAVTGSSFQLHVAYSGSQLQYADNFLTSHPQTLVVTIALGSNDLFQLAHQCGGLDLAHAPCIEAGLPSLISALKANLDTIYSHLRNNDHYTHKIVALTYYTLNYSDPVGTYIITQVDSALAERTLAWGGIVADGYTAFQVATKPYNGDACAAGLLIHYSVASGRTGCDIHPSPAGRDLLAQTILNTLRAD